MIEYVQNLAYELRLHGIHAAAERRSQQALADSLHPLELIKLLLEDERDKRKEATSKRLTTRAKFRTNAELEEWDFSAKRSITKAKLKELAMLNFYHSKQNLLIIGKTGLGKTHLSISLGKKLCMNGITTAFYSTNLFLEEVQSEKVAGKYLKFINKLKKTDVLVFDDFALRRYTHDEANILLEILEERYQKGVLIISSQVSPAGWSNLFDDSVISEAICDRLVNPSQVIELDGDSYRKSFNNVADSILS